MSNQNIKLKYGDIPIEEIPIVLPEPTARAHIRLCYWLVIISSLMIIAFIFVMKRMHDRKALRHITTKLLLAEKNIKLRKCVGGSDTSHASYIELTIPQSSFHGLSVSDIQCMFSIYVTTRSGAFVPLTCKWSLNGDMLYGLVALGNQDPQLTSISIYMDVAMIYKNNCHTTFRSLSLVVRDKNSKPIWRDSLLFDIMTGDTTVGYMGGGNLVIPLA